MDKSKSLKLLATVLIVLNLADWASSFMGNKPLKCYEKPKKCVTMFAEIEQQLRDEVPTDDVEKNMKAIEKWINEALNKSETVDLSRRELTVLSALVTINDLTQVNGRGQCKISTAKALQNNDEALKGALSKLEDGVEPKSRLVKMLKHYRDKFLDNCEFEPRLERSFNKQQLENIKSVVGELIRAHAKADLDSFNPFSSKILDPDLYLSGNPEAASSFAEKNMRSIGGKLDGEIGARFLMSVLERDGKKPLVSFDEEHDIRPIVKKYLAKPCIEYVHILDGLFSNKWARAQSLRRNRKALKTSEFYKHLAYFHGCHMILLNRRDFSEATAAALQRYDKQNRD